ncbi:MAG: Cell shape-determining protein MreC [Pseudomonadota bacterium]|jgi:rod shape-determining protein MreC
MSLDSLDRSTPAFFRQGLSSTLKLILLSALSIGLMFADHRLQVSQPIRATLSMALMPLQWASLLPGRLASAAGEYFQGLESAQDAQVKYQALTISQAQRLQRVEQLEAENTQLRAMLNLQAQHPSNSKVCEILYGVQDPYSEKLVINKGSIAGLQAGSAVIDAQGVVGQVTRTYPMRSEVTLLTDRSQHISVMNARTSVRYVAQGLPYAMGGALELQYVPTNADDQKDDLLVTSGIDGVFPAGLHVGRITLVDRKVNSSFARVLSAPASQRKGRHVLVIAPAQSSAPTNSKTGKEARP